MPNRNPDTIVNVVVAGLGGQGVLKAAEILSTVAFLASLDVKKSEIHGMSQRGGSVSSDIRYGVKVHSPMVPAGEADFLLVLTETQVDVARPMLKTGGVLITPTAVDANQLPNKKSLNVALLGTLAKHLEFPIDVWHAAIRQKLPEKLHEVNLSAFELGRTA
jgi:indolepyruvate ferredoxin oxidoreductase, beta subunit